MRLEAVFVDIDPDTLCFDIKKLKMAMTSRTRAILITYLFGMVPDINKIMTACKKNRLFVIEDFSQCLNGKYAGQKVGTFGHVGIYSSSSIKTLDTYGGGLLISNDENIYKFLRTAQAQLSLPRRKALLKKIFIDLVRNVATTRGIFHLVVFPLLRLAAKIKPESTMKPIGRRDAQRLVALPPEWFTRFTSLQAEIGMKILPCVEKADLARVKNVNRMKLRLASTKINFPKGVSNVENVYWQLVAYFDDASATQRYFYSQSIDTTTTSLSHIANLPNYPYRGITPCAERLHSNGFFIPAYPGLREKDLQHITQALRQMP
ncbi:MAG: DegT/DnrJ/EryC1/StrS aminotransferase family protein [Spirochaetes bacterium]|nr:DegT/DnrJ/EryC1/StrS aminotransferase family protein [Spirochaetota bacterium]